MISYQKESVKIETRYQVEYTEREEERIKSFPSLDEALSFYLVMFFRMCSTNDPDCIDNVKLFEQVVLDGEVIRESWIEPANTILHSLRTTFRDESIREVNDLRMQMDESTKEIDSYKAFIQSIRAEENFKNFVHQG